MQPSGAELNHIHQNNQQFTFDLGLDDNSRAIHTSNSSDRAVLYLDSFCTLQHRHILEVVITYILPEDSTSSSSTMLLSSLQAMAVLKTEFEQPGYQKHIAACHPRSRHTRNSNMAQHFQMQANVCASKV